MRPVLALAIKDLRVLLRLRTGVFFTFVWPLILTVLFGVVFSGSSGNEDAPGLRIAVVDEDGSDTSRAFIERLEQSGDFAVARGSRTEAEALVRRGDRAAFVVVPAGFAAASTQMFYGPPRRLEIGIDPARKAEAGMIEGLLTKEAMEDVQGLIGGNAGSSAVVDQALDDIGQSDDPPASLSDTARFLTELKRFQSSSQPATQTSSEWSPLETSTTSIARTRRGPSNAFAVSFPQGVIWGLIGCVMTFAIGLVSERVHGTFVRLRMAPLTRWAILGGKALACFASSLLLQVLLFGLAIGVFGVQPTSTVLLGAAALSASVAFVGFMMMIAGLSRTEQGVSGLGWATLMPLALLGGAMVPQFLMPGWMLALSNISPVKWAMLAYEGAIWRDFSAAEMLWPCTVLVAFGLGCFAVGVRGLQKES